LQCIKQSYQKSNLGRLKSKSLQPVTEVLAVTKNRLHDVGVWMCQWDQKQHRIMHHFYVAPRRWRQLTRIFSIKQI